MMDLRMRPNVHCFNVVIKALTEDGQVQEVGVRSADVSRPSPADPFLRVPAKRTRGYVAPAATQSHELAHGSVY